MGLRLSCIVVSLWGLLLLACSKSIDIGFTQELDRLEFDCMMKALKLKERSYSSGAFTIISESKSYENQNYRHHEFLTVMDDGIFHTQMFSWKYDSYITKILISENGLNNFKRHVLKSDKTHSFCIKPNKIKTCFSSNINDKNVCERFKVAVYGG